MANTKVWKRLYLCQFGGFWKPVRSGPARFFKPWIANRWLDSLLVGIPTWRNICICIYKLSLHIIYVYTITTSSIQLKGGICLSSTYSWWGDDNIPYSPNRHIQVAPSKGYITYNHLWSSGMGVMMREAPGFLGQDTSAKLVPCQQHVGPYARGLCRRRFQGWNRPARLR